MFLFSSSFSSPLPARRVCGQCRKHGPELNRQLRMPLGTHGPGQRPESRMSDRMWENMSDKMPNRQPDIVSEYMSDRMSIGDNWWGSLEESSSKAIWLCPKNLGLRQWIKQKRSEGGNARPQSCFNAMLAPLAALNEGWPSGHGTGCYWKRQFMPFIVDLPIQNGDFS